MPIALSDETIDKLATAIAEKVINAYLQFTYNPTDAQIMLKYQEAARHSGLRLNPLAPQPLITTNPQPSHLAPTTISSLTTVC